MAGVSCHAIAHKPLEGILKCVQQQTEEENKGVTKLLKSLLIIIIITFGTVIQFLVALMQIGT